MLVKKITFKFGLSAAAGLCLSAGTMLASADEPTLGGTLVVGTYQAPRHLNSAVQSGIATGLPASQIFASPLRYDADWNPQPYLAESWELSDDSLSLTLHLKENAVFHDGVPITSEDVAFSIMSIKENHPFTSMLEPVDRVDTPDAHTAVIRLSQPHPAIMLAMSPTLCPILPKHIYGDGQDLKKHPMNMEPVGSGPFKFVEYAKGQHIVLERHDDYFVEGQPYLSRVIYKINNDTNSLALEMGRGDIHLRPLVSKANELRRLSRDDGLVVTEQGYAGIGGIRWLAFNLEHPILQDKLVRQAIATAVDRDFITEALYSGFSKPALGPIAMESPFADHDIEPYDVDLDKANQMLDQAGYPVGEDGTRFTLNLDTLINLRDIAEYIKPQLKKVGIDVELRIPPDFPTWAGWVSNHDFDMTLDTVFNWGDPVIGVQRTYDSSNIRKGVVWSNTQSYSNAEVDSLLDSAAMEVDQDKRKELYSRFQQIVSDDLPVYWIDNTPYHTVYSKDVNNPPLSIWGAMSPFDEIYLD